MHKSSMKNMSRFVERYLDTRRVLKVLDLGSRYLGEKWGSYRALFDRPEWTYIGADIEKGDNVDVVLEDPYVFSFPNESFDVVISGQTFEHIERPWVTINEINRVLRPEGLCCLIAPSTGRIHRTPVDCWRIFPDGMRALAAWGNITVLECFVSNDSEWSDCVLIGKKL